MSVISYGGNIDLRKLGIKKGMGKNEVNELISEWLSLKDDVYMGSRYKHNWECSCGNIIKNRTWDVFNRNKVIICDECKNRMLNERYMDEVRERSEYEYIECLKNGDTLSSGRKIKNRTYFKIKHKYCGRILEVRREEFINGASCISCCGSYKNSMAHYIEVELGEPLEKYWDFDKNTVNPYHISRGNDAKIWIICNDISYHDSYSISCSEFIRTMRKNTSGCPYCSRNSGKVHPKDSFAQYHIDNTDKDFLEKYWDYDRNTLDPFKISPSSKKNIWIKCANDKINNKNNLQLHTYHKSYKTMCKDFSTGSRCRMCSRRDIHTYDSFGYHNFDKVMSWHPDNNVSPFRISIDSIKKYKFICDECGYVFKKRIRYVRDGSWCPQCSSSKGEKKIYKWLNNNSIYSCIEKTFDELLGKNGGNLRYDFYLPDYNLLIEYQGEQHEKYIKGVHHSYEDFERQQEHDRRKREYAENKGIRLLEIWYWDFDNIEEILNKEIISKEEK